MNSMLRDTAVALDALFLDANAAVSGTRPAGIRHNCGSSPATAAGAVSTAAEIEADLSDMLAGLEAINAPMERLAFVMTPGNARKLANKQNAGGFYPFKEELRRGEIWGAQVITSNTAPADVVVLIDLDLVYKANLGLPEVSMSDAAVLHMEDTSPQHIGYDDGGATVAAPTRSMFQTDSVAYKLVYPVGWVRRADAAVQALTSVAW